MKTPIQKSYWFYWSHKLKHQKVCSFRLRIQISLNENENYAIKFSWNLIISNKEWGVNGVEIECHAISIYRLKLEWVFCLFFYNWTASTTFEEKTRIRNIKGILVTHIDRYRDWCYETNVKMRGWDAAIVNLYRFFFVVPPQKKKEKINEIKKQKKCKKHTEWIYFLCSCLCVFVVILLFA